MKELSVFVDESGDFGPYEFHAPFYLVTLVLHDQSSDVMTQIDHFNRSLADIGLPEHTIHAGPLIRREEVYFHMTIDERNKIFHRAFNFMRSVNISYKTFIVEKKHITDSLELVGILSKQLSSFLLANIAVFSEYDRVVIYYDNGQRELTKILISVFNSILGQVEYKQATPSNYRLFQVADIICTLELLAQKAELKTLSSSELGFFISGRELKKNYIKPLRKKRFEEHHNT